MLYRIFEFLKGAYINNFQSSLFTRLIENMMSCVTFKSNHDISFESSELATQKITLSFHSSLFQEVLTISRFTRKITQRRERFETACVSNHHSSGKMPRMI